MNTMTKTEALTISPMSEAELTSVLRISPWQLETLGHTIPCRLDDTQYDSNATHFIYTIKRVGFGHKCKPYAFQYSQGSAIKRSPTLATLMYCLLSDADLHETYQNMWGMANDLGMEIKSEADYERTRAVYRGCAKTNEWLKATFSAKELVELRELFEDF